MNNSDACNISNGIGFIPVIPNNILEGLLLTIVCVNSIVFFFSIGWFVYISRKTISLNRELGGISRNSRDIEVRRNRYNIETQFKRNILILCILVAEGLHLIIKGIGFGLFFVFENLNTTNNNEIISSNYLNAFGTIEAFRYFQVTLVRIGLTNGFLLLFIVLLTILMMYLLNAYGENRDYKKIKYYSVLGLVQFIVVILTMSVVYTAFCGSLIVTIFLTIDYIMLFRTRNRLVWGLKKWQHEGGYYDDMQTYKHRKKYLLTFKRWTRVLLITLMVYILSVFADNVGNWIVMLVPNPCFVWHYYGIRFPVPNRKDLDVSINLAYILFILSNLGTLQFDFFLLFSNLIYYIITHCYFTTPSRDREVRNRVHNLIWKVYRQPLMYGYSNDK